MQLLDALEKLQGMGIAHRDIKPQNILVDEANYRLCDFEDSVTVEAHIDYLNVTTIEYSPLAMLN
jgi:serine/threonine protein kinase